MNNKNNMKRLAAISLAVMGIMLVFAQFDAARMNREIKELQKTVNYTQLFEDMLFPNIATAETGETAETAESAAVADFAPVMNFEAGEKGVHLSQESYLPLTLSDAKVFVPCADIEEPCTVAYALAINPWVLQDFLEVNGIDAMQPMTIAKGLAPELRDIRYANDSEIVWYEFSTCNTTKRCTNLSRAKNFVRDWVNYDCPTLYRYTTNQKNVIINGFGITLPVFSNVLVDTYDCKFQLDDTLTEKEINALLKHLNPKGAVAEHLNFAKKANEMGQDALWKLREEVKDTCKAINDLLHEPATRDAILKAQTEHQRDAMPMMDCGWLNWFPLEGTEFAEKFNTVRSTGNGPYFLDIDMPIIDQSVNVQSYGGDVVRDLVSKRLGIDIYYVRHLD